LKDKHLDIRIRQCLVLAEASGCPRRRFGAVLVDPTRNVVLADGYNGGPRGQAGPMCRGTWCERDGLRPGDVTVRTFTVPVQDVPRAAPRPHPRVGVGVGGDVLWAADDTAENRVAADRVRDRLLADHPPIPSGTRMELGCHHAESNVVANAAANGVSTRGSWLIVTGEPCPMCARLMHHAGVECVVVVRGGYAGGSAGVEYLARVGVRVVYRDGPRDPRGAGPYEMT
jgi:deoxycytidylate deaminase